jgi:hypothetical protein
MAKHIFKSNIAPNFAPMQVGHHYVNTLTGITYISVGISSPADWVQLNAVSATEKAGVVPASSFSGSPKTATVAFATSFTDNNYAVNITGIDNRNWSAENLTSSGFTINANANQALISQVFWSAIHAGS